MSDDDFLITHICTECNHVWLYPNVFDHACPSCGTTKPPVSVDTLAGRRERAAKGEPLDPIVMVPDKNSDMLKQFTEGVRELRQLLPKVERDAENLNDTIEAIETEAIGALGGEGYEESDEKQHVRHLYDSAKAVRHLYGRLRVIERAVSAMFILADDAESYPSGLPRKLSDLSDRIDAGATSQMPWRADASVWANLGVAQPTIGDGSQCPRCPGTLKAMVQTPIYLVCNSCGTTFADGDPLPLEGPQGAFTGEIVETGPPWIDPGETIKQFSHRADERIADQLRGIDSPGDRLRRRRERDA